MPALARELLHDGRPLDVDARVARRVGERRPHAREPRQVQHDLGSVDERRDRGAVGHAAADDANARELARAGRPRCGSFSAAG